MERAKRSSILLLLLLLLLLRLLLLSLLLLEVTFHGGPHRRGQLSQNRDIDL